jgi:hypothetical protein
MSSSNFNFLHKNKITLSLQSTPIYPIMLSTMEEVMEFGWYRFALEGGEDGWGQPWFTLARNLNEAFTIAQREVRIYGFRCRVIRYVGRR